MERSASSSSVETWMMRCEQHVELQFAHEIVADAEDLDLLAHLLGHQVEAAKQVGVFIRADDLQPHVQVAALDLFHRARRVFSAERDTSEAVSVDMMYAPPTQMTTTP